METNQRSFSSDLKWTSRFETQIKSVLGNVFIKNAPIEIDMKQATDFLVLKLEPISIACRIRKFKYLEKYKHEFTIRSSRPSGAETELKKIHDGWADYIFYGFSNEEENSLSQYFVGDLNVFREFLKYSQWQEKENFDRSSSFRGYTIGSFPKDFIVYHNFPKDLEEWLERYRKISPLAEQKKLEKEMEESWEKIFGVNPEKE